MSNFEKLHLNDPASKAAKAAAEAIARVESGNGRKGHPGMEIEDIKYVLQEAFNKGPAIGDDQALKNANVLAAHRGNLKLALHAIRAITIGNERKGISPVSFDDAFERIVEARAETKSLVR